MALNLTTPASNWDDTPGPNPHYMCMITSNNAGMSNPTLMLPMPEQFALSVMSNYDTPYSQGIIKGAIGQSMSDLGKALGISSGVTQGMTAQIWQGTNDVELSMTFELVAINDAEQDVMSPIRDLMLLTVPGKTDTGGFLTPPGPTLAGYVLNQSGLKSDMTGQISIQIGNYVRFPNVVITQVQATFSTHLDSRGKPMKANVDVTFKTFFVPIKADIPTMLTR